ncbi:nitrate/nitrite transporter [Cellulomonas sp. PS-H5]|uniref:MFS transporter n=1 Tax=Cellulomonas sp. PS-H5 TaxID=2820400 RepID=UPI001C4FA076|nr:MFS transporter [Cellulomonas sp. PS-H5]MBW0253315.1 MFS transporter [Cellulomonas sp. PS-H5]
MTSDRRALLVWSVAVGAYVVAIMNRSSLGVATLEVTDLFGVSSALLATMAVAQLVVYALLQVPVGVLLDRYGPRVLVASGAAGMALGQTVLALAPSAGWVLAGRVLVGAGDALTFVSVVRLVPAWFAARRVPVMTQLTGSLGQLGQVLSAVPVVALLHAEGWRTTFLSVAAVGVVATVAVVAVVRDAPAEADVPVGALAGPDAPAGRAAEPGVAAALAAGAAAAPAPWWRVGLLRRRWRPARARAPREPGALRAVLRDPGARLAFWMHFSGQFSNHVVVLLWGFAFFVEGQGRTPGEASALLTLNVVAAVVAGPVIGVVVGRHPRARMPLALGTSAAIGLAWLSVTLPTAPVPYAVLCVFVVVVAVGGPTSLVAFDVARSCTPPRRLGTATGFVNTGGFVGALATMLVVGIVLDAASGGADARDLDAFRSAFAWVAVPWVLGVAAMLLGRRAARRAHPGLAV